MDSVTDELRDHSAGRVDPPGAQDYVVDGRSSLRRSLKPEFLTAGFVLAWLAIFGFALFWLLQPEPATRVPAAWQHWPEAGVVQALAVSPSGILVGGRNGLGRISGGSYSALDMPHDGPQPFVLAVALAPGGDLWVGHERGVLVRSGDRWRDVADPTGGPIPEVRALGVDWIGAMWIGANGGLFRSQDGTVERIATPVARDFIVTALLADPATRSIWVGTKTGLWRRHAGRWLQWGVADGLPHPQVNALARSPDGRIWVGLGFHDRGGVVAFGGEAEIPSVTTAFTADALAGEKVRSIAADETGRIFMGHEYDGLTIRRRDGSFRFVEGKDGLPSSEVTAIELLAGGSIMLGTFNGVVGIPADAASRL